VVAEGERGNRLPIITKEELLEALKSALRSAGTGAKHVSFGKLRCRMV